MRVLAAAMFALIVVSFAFPELQPVGIGSAQLLNSNNGWAANERQVFWTTDGGAHWKEITPPKLAKGRIASIFFLADGLGWVFAAVPGNDPNGEPDFQLAFTDNAGESWDSTPLLRRILIPAWQQFGSNANINFVDRNHGWLNLSLTGSTGMAPGLLLKTDDGGKNWKSVPNAPPIWARVRFIDLRHGWLAGGPGKTESYSTQDGGRSWQSISLKPPAGVNPRSYAQYSLPTFADSRRGFLPVTFHAPEGGLSTLAVFQTTDSGGSWSLKGVIPNAGPGAIEALAAIADSTVITASAYQQNGAARVVRLGKDKPIESRVPLKDGKLAVVHQLTFGTESEGWMLANSGLLATKDGGGTWNDITPKQEPKPSPLLKSPQTQNLSPSYHGPQSHPLGFGRLPQKEHRELMRSQRASAAGTSFAPSFQFGSPNTVHIGFDTCQLPDNEQMTTWWQRSPYYDVGVYIGGSNRHCPITPTA